MRRIIALVLTVLFSLQTTASAAVPGQIRRPQRPATVVRSDREHFCVRADYRSSIAL